MTTFVSPPVAEDIDFIKETSSAPCTPSISNSDASVSEITDNSAVSTPSLYTPSYDYDSDNRNETRQQLVSLLNSVLNTRSHYDLLDEVLQTRGLEIVIRTDPSNLIQDQDLNSVKIEQRSDAKDFIRKVLTAQRQNYAKKNCHHMDNLTLKRMIPEIVRNWRKGRTDINKLKIGIPLPLVAPIITTPLRKQLLSSSEFDRNLSELSRPSSPLSYTTESDSISSSISDMTSTRSLDQSIIMSRPSRYSNTRHSNTRHSNSISKSSLSSSSNYSLTLSNPSSGSTLSNQCINSFPPNTANSNQIPHNTTHSSQQILSLCDLPALEMDIQEQLNPSHGTAVTKKDQLNAFIGLCKPGHDSGVNVNATILYNSYCRWCEKYSYEKYTRPMVIDSFREKLGPHELKNSGGRSKGWNLTLPQC
jgi:hypothetical protein